MLAKSYDEVSVAGVEEVGIAFLRMNVFVGLIKLFCVLARALSYSDL